ncbi:MAG: AAA family ATPase [Bacteroides sp.]|jgi:exodeoxyribonuclease-5|nr:AAA family ATPase [Bacteroides sp.]MBQ5818615.1 AAA family ATPase [Bacteroides sp.]
MINNYLERQIKEIFHFQPTKEQDFVIKMLATFLLSPKSDLLFLLRGYAGTGKTSLVGALVKTLDMLKQKTILLAPTGRAAKVLSSYANHPAFTIHKKIYRQKSFADESASFSICDNLNKHTLFLVDEASMISNEGLSGSMFGSGRLLDDLIQYVYSGEGCRLLILGDTAQLPPVGEEQSPALSAMMLAGYGLEVMEANLTQVVRQAESSGILWNATALRKLLVQDECYSLPKIRITGFPDVKVVPGNELMEALEACYDNDGLEETIVVCRSNKRANIYNNGIRSRILWREDELNNGDLLMIAKNNYYWTEQEKDMDFIANGELAVVQRVRRQSELYGFRFVDVTLTFPDQDNYELDANLLLDTLQSESPALTRADADRLFNAVLEDYADIPLKRERMKKMKADPYYNALQVKYAYAVTCHKAQGGQWKNVFIDQGYMSDEYLSPDYFRWLYTAFTRATGTLYLVNYPQEQTE